MDKIVKGEPLTISVDAEDIDGYIEEVKFYIDKVYKGLSESVPYEYTWNTLNESIGYCTIKAIAYDNSEESIDEKSIVFSDKSISYIDIADYVELHVTKKSDEETTKETLKWILRTISNPK